MRRSVRATDTTYGRSVKTADTGDIGGLRSNTLCGTTNPPVLPNMASEAVLSCSWQRLLSSAGRGLCRSL